MTQCEAILAALKRGEIVTPETAYRLCGTHALHSRISELRERGHAIDCELVETAGGKTVGKYTLQARHNAPQRAPVALDAPYQVGQLRRERGRLVTVTRTGTTHDGMPCCAVRDV